MTKLNIHALVLTSLKSAARETCLSMVVPIWLPALRVLSLAGPAALILIGQSGAGALQA